MEFNLVTSRYKVKPAGEGFGLSQSSASEGCSICFKQHPACLLYSAQLKLNVSSSTSVSEQTQTLRGPSNSLILVCFSSRAQRDTTRLQGLFEVLWNSPAFDVHLFFECLFSLLACSEFKDWTWRCSACKRKPQSSPSFVSVLIFLLFFSHP